MGAPVSNVNAKPASRDGPREGAGRWPHAPLAHRPKRPRRALPTRPCLPRARSRSGTRTPNPAVAAEIALPVLARALSDCPAGQSDCAAAVSARSGHGGRGARPAPPGPCRVGVSVCCGGSVSSYGLPGAGREAVPGPLGWAKEAAERLLGATVLQGPRGRRWE